MRTATRARAIATIAVLGLFAAACGDDETTPAATTPTTAAEVPATTAAPVADGPKVGLVFDIGGRGDQSFNDAAAELGITFTEASPNDDGSNRKELLDLAAESSDIVIAVGFLFEADAAAVGIANPDKTFGVIDSAMLDFANGAVPYGDNIAGLVFSEEQGSFLVGAAAALKSTSGQIGFIGGVKGVGGLIERFEAGYIAGAKAVNPDIKIVSEYITEAPDFDGFNAPDRARDIASAMYAGGADIVYHAAGGSGAGLFEAAKATSDESGTKVWAIGVDSDQYNTSDAAVKEFILTSMLKRVDVAVYEIIKAHIEGKVVGGPTAYNLSVDGVGYATSGGFVDDIVADLDAFKAKIISGEIVVPTDPAQA